ncbi:MAG TPA: HD domain-containing phosphohydrolase [Actinomycetota bacterium]|nr:HD domain-containing phosphohydrolase [Actinomycetota bacterium]
MATRLRLADLLAGLSTVADMGYGLPQGHALRSCLIGVGLARRLGLPDPEIADTFYASMLVHVGCVGFSHEMYAAFGDEMAANRAGAKTNFADPKDIVATLIPETMRGLPPSARVGAAAFILTHGRALGRRYDTTVCEVGRETARRLGLSEGVQRALYEVKEHWKGGGAPRGLKGEQILLPARIARVAAEAALFDYVGGSEMVVPALRRRAGGLLDPAVVAELLVRVPEVLDEVRTWDPRELVLAAEPDPVVEKELAELPNVAAAFGDLADLKSTFTHGHSRNVARLAKTGAQRLGLEAGAIEMLEVAAALHDLGRVGISDAIWEKPGPLDAVEWEQVRLHPYYSERILSKSQALVPVATIAGMHHERLDCSGYHRGCGAGQITISARVLAAADAFQAMTEHRPHRAALDSADAATELRRAARDGELDPEAVACVIEAAGLQRGPRRELRPAGLSEREVEVLRLVARACSNREIGQQLHISPRTAEHHVQHIYTKLGLSSRSALALYAMEHDLLPPSRDS